MKDSANKAKLIARMQRQNQQSHQTMKAVGKLAAADTAAMLIWLCAKHQNLNPSDLSQDNVLAAMLLIDMALMAAMLRNYWQIANNNYDIAQLKQQPKTK